MSQCHGRKPSLVRCEKQAGKKWFCSKHKYQPRVTTFGVLTTILLGWIANSLPTPEVTNGKATARDVGTTKDRVATNIASELTPQAIVKELSQLPLDEAMQAANTYLGAKITVTLNLEHGQPRSIGSGMAIVMLDTNETVSAAIEYKYVAEDYQGVSYEMIVSKPYRKLIRSSASSFAWREPVHGVINNIVLTENKGDSSKSALSCIELRDCSFPTVSSPLIEKN